MNFAAARRKKKGSGGLGDAEDATQDRREVGNARSKSAKAAVDMHLGSRTKHAPGWKDVRKSTT